MKILVTGASGFIGRKLVPKLALANEVIVINRKHANFQAKNIREICHNLLFAIKDKFIKEIENIDAVIHLATLTTDSASSYDDKKSADKNIVMTKNILSLFDKIKKPKIFIFGSTIDVYQSKNTLTNYAKSKIECEKLCQNTIKKWPKTTLCILRFSQVYGEGDTHKKAINTFVKNISEGKAIEIYGDGSDKRTYLHVNDAVQAIDLALEKPSKGIFDIAGEKVYTINQLIDIIKNDIKDLSVIYLARKKSKYDSIISIKKAQEAFNFQPKINLKNGIHDLLKNKKQKLFFDLDGPILDVKERYYKIYKEFVQTNKGKILTIKEYWDLKRTKCPVDKILKKSSCSGLQDKYKIYLSKYREAPDYLALDELQNGVKKNLSSLKKDYDLYLLTLRRNSKTLMKQLTDLKLTPFFKDILTGFQDQERFEVKANLIREKALDEEGSIIIGDTETEVYAAKSLNFKSIIISNGIRNETLIKEASPDKICDSLCDLPKCIKQTFHQIRERD